MILCSGSYNKFGFRQLDNIPGNEEKKIRHFYAVRIAGSQRFGLIFKIISKVSEYPVGPAFCECFQFAESIAGIGGHRSGGTGSEKTFNGGMRKGILMIIQKTTNVEPVAPIQHLFFGLLKISYRKRNKSSYQFIL
jgi:hypothetical protein